MFLDGHNIHFIGVGGVSMSALAKYCLSIGCKVSGSDNAYSDNVISLCNRGINAYIGERPCFIDSADIIVYTSAISEENAELNYAKYLKKQIYERAEFLGKITADYKNVVAVSGTHGKTTVTSLISEMLLNANKKIVAHIGGQSKSIGNYIMTGSDYFVTEACEYRRHFLSLYPSISIILNIELDHPDTYKSIDELYDAFTSFANNTQNDGFIIVFDNVKYDNMHISKDVQVLTFGKKATSTIWAKDIYYDMNGCTYDVVYKGEYYATIHQNFLGEYNVMNALCCILVGEIYNIDKEIIVDTIANFLGVKRRFEKILSVNGASVYLDYAHHPTEIKSVIEVAKRITNGRVLVYFQPHTYSRTKEYLDEFCKAVLDADFYGFVKTYPSRESECMGKSAFDLFYYFNDNYGEACYLDSLSIVANDIYRRARQGDVVLLLGAGDIEKVCKLL